MSFVFVDMSALVAADQRLERDEAEIPKAANESAALMAKRVAEQGREWAPHRSGALADSVEAEDLGDGMMAAAAGNEDVPYAGPIHWGWPDRHIDGQPFLWRAYIAEMQHIESGEDNAVIEPVLRVLEE